MDARKSKGRMIGLVVKINKELIRPDGCMLWKRRIWSQNCIDLTHDFLLQVPHGGIHQHVAITPIMPRSPTAPELWA